MSRLPKRQGLKKKKGECIHPTFLSPIKEFLRKTWRQIVLYANSYHGVLRKEVIIQRAGKPQLRF